MIHFLRYTEGHMEKVSDLGFQGHRSITCVIHSYKTYFHDLCTIPVPTRCDLCLSGFFRGSGYFKLAIADLGNEFLDLFTIVKFLLFSLTFS